MDFTEYGIYVLRWAILAVPGAWFFSQVQQPKPGNAYPDWSWWLGIDFMGLV